MCAFKCGLYRGRDIPGARGIENRVPVMVECLRKILHQKVVVIVGDPAALEFRCRLIPGVDCYLGPGFADDQCSFGAKDVQLDLAAVWVASCW